jgi:general secretion pathway protein D
MILRGPSARSEHQRFAVFPCALRALVDRVVGMPRETSDISHHPRIAIFFARLERRTVLKTTPRLLIAAIAVGLGLPASAVWAAPNLSGARAMLAVATAGQAEGQMTADDLLQRAQAALDSGNLESADLFIAQAEAMNPKYGLFHRGPTPDKLRKALDEKRGGGKPRASLNPFANRDRNAEGQADPFAKRNMEPTATENRYATEAATQPAADNRYAEARAVDNPYVSNEDRSGAAAPLPQAAQQAMQMTSQARAALQAGDLDSAERIAREASRLGVANSAYPPGADQPSLVMLDVAQARRQAEGVRTAQAVAGRDSQPVERGVYRSDRDRTQNRYVQSETETQDVPRELPRDAGPARGAPTPAGGPTEGQRAFDAGVAALQAGDRSGALSAFRRAYDLQDQLDPSTTQRLQDHLQMLTIRNAGPAQPPAAGLESVESQQQQAQKQLFAEAARRQADARRMLETDPRGSLELLRQTHRMVAESDLDAAMKNRMLTGIDRSIVDTEKYLKDHQFELDLNAKNKEIKDQVDRRRQHRLEVDDELAKKVEEFNRLMDERRFAEAELLAKRSQELDPDNVAVIVMVEKAKFVRALMENKSIRDAKERGFVEEMQSIDIASTPQTEPFSFGNLEKWEDITNRRRRFGRDGQRRMSERDKAIEQKLSTPVMARFKDQPLVDVIQELARAAAINVYLDPRGLDELGIAPDYPVTLNLSTEVTLKSALNLILEPLELGYVIKDEVLKVTSDARRGGEVYLETYHVADLVIPIPNFVPTSRLGLAGELHNAHMRQGYGGYGSAPFASAPPAMSLAGAESVPSGAVIDPALLAQINASGGFGGGRGGPMTVGGPGGMGGGATADFESIIELVTSTVAPTTWDAVGGSGNIKEFQNNLTLVISQTQEVHEQIVDLLEQLRRLQDLQVTIEVRFITLTDDFFERIGIDFDFDLDDNVGVDAFNRRVDRQTVDIDGDGIADIPNNSGQPGNGDSGNGISIGLQGAPAATDLNGDGINDVPGSSLLPVPLYTTDLDFQFRQGSFGSTAPMIGGFNPATAATFGFAILSDIEAYFFLQAAQGDVRTNVLQAPKVTLFNGQQAYVSDTAQVPFVTSVIPVVGDFAAAHQPVIVVLSEGTALTIQAVVSNDRRFVRLTVVPFFSKIGDVDTFTFNGSTTTIRGSSSTVDGDDDSESEEENETVIQSGTTVQLPTFEFVTVSTTVSVPDGGTVLLGGVKRLSEERREEGVPMLSKLPYISRLFKNVGIGRTTQSLMMMVTPRIIIQEEEEQRLGITANE